MKFIKRLKVRTWRWLFEELSFNQVLVMYIGRKALQAARSAVPTRWHITRWVAGILSRHEDEFVRELAELAEYKFLSEVPALDMICKELNLAFCKASGCLPVCRDNVCVGIAVCDPSQIEGQVLEALGQRAIYLVTVAAMQTALDYCEALQDSCVELSPQSLAEQDAAVFGDWPNIALLDDNNLFLGAAERVLASLGLCGRTYNSPSDLIEDIKGKRLLPSLVITDLNMPEMSGFDVAQSLIAEGFKSQNIVIASADDSIATEVMVLKLGLGGLIRKAGGVPLFSAYLERFLVQNGFSNSVAIAQ